MSVETGKDETDDDETVSIPILQNCRALKEGDELLVFKESLVEKTSIH